MSDAKITLSAEDKTKAAFGDVKRNLLGLQQSAMGINQSFGSMGAVLGSAFAGLSLTAFIKSVSDGLDKLNDVKDATGASVENISALEDVAARTGTSFDAMAASLTRLNAALNDSKPGSDNANVFKSLGLDVAELKRLDPAQALLKTAVAFSNFADSGEKARVIQQLFGRSVREVAPFLNELAAAGELNAKATEEQAQEAEKFNKELLKLTKNSTDLARALLEDVIPAINNVFGAARQEGGLAKLFQIDGLGNRIDQVMAAYRLIGLARERITPLSILDKDPTNEKAIAELARIDAQAKQFGETLNNARRQMLGIGTSEAGAGRGFINPPMVRPDLVVKPPRPAAKAEKPLFTTGQDLIPEALKEARKLIDDTDVNKVAKYREQLQELIAINNADPGKAGVIEAINTLALKLNDLNPEYRAAIEAQKKLNDLLDKTPTGKMNKLRDEVVLLEQAFQDGYFGLVGSTEAVDAFQAAVADLTKGAADDVRKAVDNMDEFSKQAARNIQDALGSTLKATLRGDFDSIGDLWANMLLDMAAQAAAAQLGKMLLGDFATSGNIGGLLGDGIAWLGTLGVGRADGGPVGARSLQRVNERGFEVFTDANGGDWLMTGTRGGYVTPNTQLGQGSGRAAPASINVVNNTTVSAGVQRGEVFAIVQHAMRDSEARTYNQLKNLRVIA